MRAIRARRFGASLGSLLVAGCAVVPSFQRPAPPADAAYANLPAAQPGTQRIATGADIPADWWTLFHSPALDALVRRAIAANPDLAAARAALRQSQELAKADRGVFLPSIGVDASTARARNPGVLASPLQSNSNLYTLSTAQLTIGYTLDLFGGARRQAESSAATAEAQRFQSEAAYLTLTSNVVVAAITEASLREQIAATERSIAAQVRILEILRARLRLGDVARADVAAQEALLAQTQQALPPLTKQLAQQRDLIAVLAGQMPGSEQPRVDLATVVLPANLPLSLPARLVDQRPDVRAAEAQLHAAGAQVGVAIAARLPAITLGGDLGGSSTNFSTLLAPENILWNVVGGLTAPLFDGGTLRHRQHAAEAACDQAKAQYRGAVLAAFQNVSDALAAVGSDTEALHAADRAERAAADSLVLAQGQGRLGAIAPLQVLAAEQAYWQASVTLQQARAALYVDAAALFQALGGGWWNRPAER
ncbi:efflux transporter outer membrane subunit [Sphingomonas morindae]|uniref:Efflux transporter outer membrane subunit n=1 Tax=Sphingomonas morindae TaxID=1541170 RepID=A0ABY4XD51_9SPHN|nr:efflux transporter outer membrane subunit [Sphingomonas morindae]USI74676.1 efflux transporter outer membrane subunit [Sphingomonas morindae]